LGRQFTDTATVQASSCSEPAQIGVVSSDENDRDRLVLSPETPDDPKTGKPRDLVGLRFYAVVVCAFLAMVAAFYGRTSKIPPVGDAAGYLLTGQQIQSNGLMARHTLSSVRTIAYPAFVAVATKNPLPVSAGAKIVMAQALLYWLAATLLLVVSPRLLQERRARRLLAVGLFLNPLAALYCAEILTEGMSLVALYACLAVVLAPTRDGRWRPFLPFCLGLIAGVALIIRPANLAAATIPPLFRTGSLRRRLGDAAASLVPALIGIYVAVSPQIASNWRHFGKMTPLPTVELGKFQLQSGIALLKYGTFVHPAGVEQIRYANPFSKDIPLKPNDGFDWYRRNLAAGLLSVVGHAFATVTQDPLYSYTTDMKPWYRIPVIALNALFVLGGLAWLLGLFWRHRRVALATPAACFLLTTVAATLTIGAFSAAESRFGLQVVSIAFVGACLAVGHTADKQLRSISFIAALAGSPLFIFLAFKLGALAVLVPIGR
jgi:hypothetical protein